jgi:hypothetical protein
VTDCAYLLGDMRKINLSHTPYVTATRQTVSDQHYDKFFDSERAEPMIELKMAVRILLSALFCL